MKNILHIGVLLLFSIAVRGQFTTNVEWKRTLGGTGTEVAWKVDKTSDGGYVVAGSATSNNGDLTFNRGNSDFWIVKLSGSGATQWQKSYGSRGNDVAYSVKQTSDGGYIVVGTAGLNGGDVSGNTGTPDYWIVKLDGSGALVWQKSYGGGNTEIARDVVQTLDGGYIVVGESNSLGGKISGSHGGYDCWVLKLTDSGSVQWNRAYGGTGDDFGYTIVQTADSGYVITGTSTSDNGDVSGNHRSLVDSSTTNDCWVLKINKLDSIEWSRLLGGSGADYGRSVQQTIDGGYIVAGQTSSNDGDVYGNHSNDTDDYWVVKLDMGGNITWQTALGGTWFDDAYAIQQTADSGYIVAGLSNSLDGDVTENHGNYDYWIVKLDSSGTIQMQKSFGGTGDDYAYSIEQVGDAGFIVAGTTNSNNGDVSGNHGDFDFWVLKLSPVVGIEEETGSLTSFDIYPNPVCTSAVIDFTLKRQQNVRISITDIAGRLVQYLLQTNLSSGLHHISWNLVNNAGNKIDSGIYFMTVETPNGSATKKLIVIK